MISQHPSHVVKYMNKEADNDDQDNNEDIRIPHNIL
jgi:hypothetical protein